MDTLLSYIKSTFVTYTTITTLLITLSLLPLPTIPTFYIRFLLSNVLLITCAAYGLLASLFLTLTPYGHRSTQWLAGRAFSTLMRLTTGISFEVVSGGEHLTARPAIFIANHQTELDVCMLGTVFPPWCSVTAKKSLRLVPFLGWFMTLSGTVFIDRGNSGSARKAFDEAVGTIRGERQSVFIFPEGTRSNAQGPKLAAFKKGAFHLAVQSQTPVVPVVVGCYAGVLSAREKRFRGGRIPVRILPPVETRGLGKEDVDELCRSTREVMLQELVSLTETEMGRRVALPEGRTGMKADGLAMVNGVGLKGARR